MIKNSIWKDGREVKCINVTEEPYLAYYSKEGKVLNAFQDAKELLKQNKQQVVFSKLVSALQTFFKRYAVLATALPETLNDLRQLASKAAQSE